MPKYADLFELPEDDRIRAIAETAEHNHSAAFIVEDNEKADRYIAKLTSRFKIVVVARGDGPVNGTVCVKVERRSDA